jgi:hypothetical protein
MVDANMDSNDLTFAAIDAYVAQTLSAGAVSSDINRSSEEEEGRSLPVNVFDQFDSFQQEERLRQHCLSDYNGGFAPVAESVWRQWQHQWLVDMPQTSTLHQKQDQHQQHGERELSNTAFEDQELANLRLLHRHTLERTANACRKFCPFEFVLT